MAAALPAEEVLIRRSLSQWAAQYVVARPAVPHEPGPYAPVGPLSAEAQESKQAIREIGTNAFPLMLKWISHEAPVSWRFKLSSVMYKLPFGINRWSTVQSLRVKLILSKLDPSETAFACYEALGDEASPLVPALTKQMNDLHSLELSRQAIKALALIGRPGVLALTGLVTNTVAPSNLRCYTIFHITSTGGNAIPAVPALVCCLQGQEIEVADISAQALGTLALEPSVTLPALTNALSMGGPLSNVALRALRQFQTQRQLGGYQR